MSGPVLEIVVHGPIRYTRGTPEQYEHYRQKCIKDGTAHLYRESFGFPPLNAKQMRYLQKLVRIKRGLNRARRRQK